MPTSLSSKILVVVGMAALAIALYFALRAEPNAAASVTVITDGGPTQ